MVVRRAEPVTSSDQWGRSGACSRSAASRRASSRSRRGLAGAHLDASTFVDFLDEGAGQGRPVRVVRDVVG